MSFCPYLTTCPSGWIVLSCPAKQAYPNGYSSLLHPFGWQVADATTFCNGVFVVFAASPARKTFCTELFLCKCRLCACFDRPAMGRETFAAGVVVFPGRDTASEQYSVGPQSDVNLWEFGSSLLFETRHGSPRAWTRQA